MPKARCEILTIFKQALRPLVKFLLSASALLELASIREENIEARLMQCSQELGFQRSVFPLPSLQPPLEQRQQGWRSMHLSQDILAIVSR